LSFGRVVGIEVGGAATGVTERTRIAVVSKAESAFTVEVGSAIIVTIIGSLFHCISVGDVAGVHILGAVVPVAVSSLDVRVGSGGFKGELSVS
jgi:hypothetical protein